MRKIYASIIALLISATLLAATRTAEEAAVIAAQFTNGQSSSFRAPRAAGEFRLAHRTNKPQSAEPALYVFNKPNDGGFVIVSADDNAVTILGYSDEGAFDSTYIPGNVQFWLDYYAERIASAQPGTRAKAPAVRTAAQTTAVQPLLGGIKWNQDNPYNKKCPTIQGRKCPTGCVATAAAQIMKFWEWPVQGQGSYSYTVSGQSLSANFGNTTYDWNNMLNKYTSGYNTTQADAVATLMYHVGVACKMEYDPKGSGALTDDMRKGFVSYFKYKNTAQYIRYKTTAELTSLFLTELAANRPILLGGADSDSYDAEGHAFVCDGVDTNGLFHINWGWGGTSDGYFALSSLDPEQEGIGGASSGNGYSHDIDCIIGIEPDRNPVSVTGVTLSPATATIKIRERYELTPTVSPANASNKALSWSSSNEAVAKVTEGGAVVGISAGTAIITVKTNDGNYTSTCQITVTDEIAPAIELAVDNGYAQYSESDGGWVIALYDSSTEVPWVQFYTEKTGSNKIAGAYNIQGDNIYMWNDPNDTDAYLASTSGQIVITCVGKDNGASGCNTYTIQATFVANDEAEYALNVTLELCGKDEAESPIDLEDNVGDGTPIEVTWMANGNEFASNIAADGKVVLPGIKPTDCECGKVFVGWSAQSSIENGQKPADLFTTAPSTTISSNKTYYAVYAEETTEGATPAEVARVTFQSASSDNTIDNSDDIKAKLVNTDEGISAYSGTKLFKGKQGLKMGASKAPGSLTLTLTNTVSVTKVVVNASQFGTDTGTLQVSAGSQVLGSKSPASNLEYAASTPVETNTITLTTTQRAYVSSISVVAGGVVSHSNYTTACGCDETAIENTELAPKAEKTVENGQIVILRGNEKYTVFGQKIK